MKKENLRLGFITLFWLGVLRDSDLVPKELSKECEYLIKETKEIANISSFKYYYDERKKKIIFGL